MYMSERDTFWLSLAEKFFGLLLTIIGALFLYFTVTSTATLGGFSGFFGFLGIVVLIIGVFLLLVRPPE
jgi:predicted phage tail protein